MSSHPAYQRELSLPLIEGIHETPPWGSFMRRLVDQSYARRAFLIITLVSAAPSQAPAVIHVAAPRAADDPPLDFRRIAALDLHPYGLMRPERVYALEEMLDHNNPAVRDSQRAALSEMGIQYGRWLRISVAGVADAWLLLVREREDFSAFAGSLLTAIVPHFAAALRTFVALSEQRLLAALTARATERIGLAQLAFDARGRVVTADPLAERLLAFLPGAAPQTGRRLQLLPDVERALDAACAELAGAHPDRRRLIRIDPRAGYDLLLRPSDLRLDEPALYPAVLGALKLDVRENPARAVQVIAELHGLSANEASLAHGLTMGETIEQAGRRLHLTEQTARIYSKRIYAKTGTKGQADLVRLLTTGLARHA